MDEQSQTYRTIEDYFQHFLQKIIFNK